MFSLAVTSTFKKDWVRFSSTGPDRSKATPTFHYAAIPFKNTFTPLCLFLYDWNGSASILMAYLFQFFYSFLSIILSICPYIYLVIFISPKFIEFI